MTMFEILKPTSLDRFDPFNDSLQAVSVRAFGVLSDIIPEFLDTFVAGKFHPLLEFVTKKFKDLIVGVDDLGFGRVQDQTY